MHHIEQITVTISGFATNPEIYTIPKQLGRDLRSYIASQKADITLANVVLPELADDIKRPATVLRGLRHRENLTQKQLAEKLAIRQHHLSEMENGKRPIGKEMAKKLAEILRSDWKMFL